MNNNKAITFLAVFFTGLVAAMLVYIGWYSYANRVEFVMNDYNKRASQLQEENSRGSIISSDGKELALTVTDEEGNEVRSYPYANQFAHVVGYADMGGMGIEKSMKYYLINCNSSLATKASYDDKGLKFPGDNVYTTINASLQVLAYYSLGDYNGAVIISDPNTGAILAMVSKPDFNPNTIKADWNTLSNDKTTAALVNRSDRVACRRELEIGSLRQR